jgi:hypothetical protein
VVNAGIGESQSKPASARAAVDFVRPARRLSAYNRLRKVELAR